MARPRFSAPYRCARCLLRRGLCLCAELPRLATRTRVVVFLHPREWRTPSNTGRLAAACLIGARTVVHSVGPAADPPLTFDEGTRPVLLLPTRDAAPIETLRESASPITLVVPDGTWSQARRMGRRIAARQPVPCVRLPANGPPVAYLRRGGAPGRLPTIAAIARAFGILESPAVEAALLDVLARFVDRTRWTRGELPAGAVRGGLPPGVVQHDPWR
jgi:DTW domain-containing protein YfiP